ncbi:hypothetical protein CN425_23545 [Bacillus cereus]|uniref:Uncharacterized protein n=1 Tax=Bacillus cereus TaxID=1396 RepID=A0A2B1KR52_BACCE|nr:hypothetical protein CON38_08540 [Bacillus cereus]PEV97357.1 hypothetical protein CN425_23545 [Bacillus cereus]PEX92719.1 hypothetical protein CN450_04750 [Bacillus cereus]PFI25074.1 hypothetical protein COI75_08220 [Bacillus cereus]PFN28954.1 hypothetical protein COJ50_02995 [Bacillus cereus]
MTENPFYTLPLYSNYYLYFIIAYRKEEIVDTTYGDVIIKFPYLPLEFLHYLAMIIYQYSTGYEVILDNVPRLSLNGYYKK